MRGLRWTSKNLVKNLIGFVFVSVFLIFSQNSFAQSKITQWMTAEEFKNLGVELAQKVNLFEDVWKVDPNAEFIGGTSRDFFYWLKGKLSKARDQREFNDIIRRLKKEKIFDVRDFIVGDSDVDIASSRSFHSLNPDKYGVKRIDPIGRERFDQTTPQGRDEVKQGYIPVEKITGIVPWSGMGDGASEIFTGKPTVHFSSDADFSSTYFANLKINHPVLLAFRYVRLLAMNHFYDHGKGYPNHKELFDIDKNSEKNTLSVIQSAMDGAELIPYLKKDKFVSWINQTIQKAFRSYTNPTAAMLLMTHFGAKDVSGIYDEIKPFNRYLFAKYRDEKKIEANLDKFGVKRDAFFQSRDSVFPSEYLYHGTRTERAFRGILFQGILPSDDGTAGDGLYGVAERNVSFASSWGGSINRVVKCHIKEDAKIVDITHGEGRRIFRKFGKSETEFAEFFGVDIIRYYYDTEAFVVKNAAAIDDARGYKRDLLSLSELIQQARTTTVDTFLEFLGIMFFNQVRSREAEILVKNMPSFPLRDGFLESIQSGVSFKKYLTDTIDNLETESPTLDSVSQLLQAVTMLGLPYQLEFKLIDIAFKKGLVTSAVDFISLLDSPRASSSSDYKIKLREFIVNNLRLFFSLNPSASEIMEVISNDSLRIADRAELFSDTYNRHKEYFQDSTSLVHLFDINLNGLRAELKKDTTKTLLEILSNAISLGITPSQISTAMKNLKIASAIRMELAKHILSKYDFNSVNDAFNALVPEGTNYAKTYRKKVVAEILGKYPLDVSLEKIRTLTRLVETTQLNKTLTHSIRKKIMSAIQEFYVEDAGSKFPEDQRPQLAVKAFREFTKVGYFSPKNAIPRAVLSFFERIRQDETPFIIKLDPGVDSLSAFALTYVRFEPEILFRQKVVESNYLKNPKDFIQFLKSKRITKNEHYTDRIEDIIERNILRFLRLLPTEQQIDEYIQLHRDQDRMRERVLGLKARLKLLGADSIQEFLKTISDAISKMNIQNARKWTKENILEEEVDKFFSFNPALSECGEFLGLHLPEKYHNRLFRHIYVNHSSFSELRDFMSDYVNNQKEKIAFAIQMIPEVKLSASQILTLITDTTPASQRKILEKVHTHFLQKRPTAPEVLTALKNLNQPTDLTREMFTIHDSIYKPARSLIHYYLQNFNRDTDIQNLKNNPRMNWTMVHWIAMEANLVNYHYTHAKHFDVFEDLDYFFGLKPTIETLVLVRNRANSPEKIVKLNMKAVSKKSFKSASEWIEYFSKNAFDRFTDTERTYILKTTRLHILATMHRFLKLEPGQDQISMLKENLKIGGLSFWVSAIPYRIGKLIKRIFGNKNPPHNGGGRSSGFIPPLFGCFQSFNF